MKRATSILFLLYIITLLCTWAVTGPVVYVGSVAASTGQVEARCLHPLNGDCCGGCPSGYVCDPSTCSCVPGTPSHCDPNLWSLYGSQYSVKITTVDTDKGSYRPGETVSILGIVELSRSDVYVNGCGQLASSGGWVNDQPSLVSVQVSGGLGSAAASVGNSGAFIANVDVPDTASSGTYKYTIEASYDSVGDTGYVSFQVAQYTPTISVSESTVHPGDSVSVSGSGWAPDKDVTVTLFGASNTATGPDFGGIQFTVPDDANPGSYEAKATQGSLHQEATVQVAAYTPTLTASPTTAYPGDTITVSGTGWAPNRKVTVTLFGASNTATGPDFGGIQFTVPGNTAKGDYQANAVQGKLAKDAGVSVKWHQLILTLTVPSSVPAGESFDVNGKVASDAGAPVAGASVQVNIQGVAPLSAVSGSDGSFTASGSVPSTTKPQSYAVSASAVKTPGYDAAEATSTLQVTPPLVSVTEVTAASAGGALGAVAAAGVAVRGKIPGEEAVDDIGSMAGRVKDAVDKTKDVIKDLPIDEGSKKTITDKLDGLSERAGQVKQTVDKIDEYKNALDDNLDQTRKMGISENSRDFLGWWRVTWKAVGEVTQKFVDGLAKPFTSLFGKTGEQAFHAAVPVQEFGDELSKMPTSAAKVFSPHHDVGNLRGQWDENRDVLQDLEMP